MEVDSPSEPAAILSPRDRLIQRLSISGIPEEYLADLEPGLVYFVKNNKSIIPDIVSAILPSDADIAEAVNGAKSGSRRALGCVSLRDLYCESMIWLEWLMFEGDPILALKNLAQISGQHGVCGFVWGKNELAFRCRTCELDPTCAICVPCFQNGNHRDHDYSIIYTGGGCCDCGDETAWKHEGFCSKHKGAEQIQPLPDELANSVKPVLDALFKKWKEKLLVAEMTSREDASVRDLGVRLIKAASELAYAVVAMLIEFCNNSECLLSFVSERLMTMVGLIDLLVRAERFLSSDVTKKLHELLLKLLGEPTFKYEFAKIFVDYYSVPVAEVLKECSDNVMKKYPLLSLFAVQIFTVPTLTPRLVKERNLLVILLECLREIFLSCCGQDGKVQFNKWVNVFETCARVMEDIKFVLSHPVIAKYVTHKQIDIVETWLQILSLVQGINPQKRETGIHVEEENESVHLPFYACDIIAKIHLLLVESAFCIEETDGEAPSDREIKDTEDIFGQRHAKVGRLSEESSVCSSAAQTSVKDSTSHKFDGDNHLLVLPSVCQLTFESVRAINSWLAGSNIAPSMSSSVSHGNFLAFKRTLLKFRKGKCISRLLDGSSVINKHSDSSDVVSQYSSNDINLQVQSGMLSWPMDTSGLDHDSSTMETETSSEKDSISLLSFSHWPDIEYDVNLQEISVHLPLHGLLSLLLKEALRNYYAENSVRDKGMFGCLNPVSSNDHEFFLKMLNGCHPYGFSAFMMEHPLQIRVFYAGVRAGMWRRNGDAAITAFEWYRSIRWSDHELELDLFLLQICAALAPVDLFVTRLLERFQLTNYLTLDLKRSNEYEPMLVQELITLIIQIVKERRFCGLTASESLQRELICKLSTGDSTHSQLVKSLPGDLSKLDELQEVLDKVAQYSNPSGMNQGKYALRQSFWKELDLYHPCWNPKDLQIAEERYSRFCGVSALSALLPKWTYVYEPLVGVARVATCKSTLQIIRAVVFYSVFTDRSAESRAPDGVLIAALHLLSLGLDICFLERRFCHQSIHGDDDIPLLVFASEEIGMEMHSGFCKETLLSLLVALMSIHRKQNMNFMEAGSLNLSALVENLLKKFTEIDSKCMMKLQNLSPEIVNHKPDEAVNFSSASDSEKLKMKARERQAAILAKMKAEQSKFLAASKSASDCGSEDSCLGKEEDASDSALQSEETHICCLCRDPSSRSPLSFLILFQKSRLLSFVDRGPPSWDPDCPLDGLVSSVEPNETTNPSAGSVKVIVAEGSSSQQLMKLMQGAVDEFACQAYPAELNSFREYLKSQFPEARFLNISGRSGEKRDIISYSLESSERDMFLSMCKEMNNNIYDFNFVNHIPSGDDAAQSSYQDVVLLGKYIAALTTESTPSESGTSQTVESSGQTPSYDGFGPMDCDGVHISSCGHAVHQGCLDRYLSSLKERYSRRVLFEGGHIVDLNQGEFLCPVCRCLANSTVPAAPHDSYKFWEQPGSSTDSLAHYGSSGAKVKQSTFRLQKALSMLKSAGTVVSRADNLKNLPLQRNGRVRPNLEPIFRVLTGMYFPGKQDIFSRSGRVSPSFLMWDTLKYTIMSTEVAARCGRSSFTGCRGLNSLYSEFRSSGGFVLPLLLRIIQSTRTKNLADMLLRLRGIQLFATSICCGFSLDKGSRQARREEGNILWILKHVHEDVVFPDTQFWTEASSPVLTRDPFSTLMFVLFCLPYPFLSTRECFISLVHLFYGVAVAQAIITYCVYVQQDVNQLGFRDCLVSDVAALCGKSMIAKLFFMSNHVDPSCDIDNVVHNLSLPYLRRCALLWKLVKSCAELPSPSRVDIINKPLDIADFPETSDILVDINEVGEFQDIFELPPLDAVFKDEMLRSMVFKWFNHFSEEFEDRVFQRTLHLSPAVPFKLMHLPLVYQDLVQRYIRPKCPNCKGCLDEPVLCLLCGRLCSPPWKPCCRESGCQRHAMACGAGTGVFLLIRKTTILLQRNARQASWPSLYLDTFGEEDFEMRRGKPLFLNEERYAALTYLVASHGLDRTSKVLRQTTVATFLMM